MHGQCKESVEALQRTLACFGYLVTLDIDTSNYGTGTVLSQDCDDGQEHVAYASLELRDDTVLLVRNYRQ